MAPSRGNWNKTPLDYTLSQLARAVGLDIGDVRFYRDSGLLQPPRRVRGRNGDVAFFAEHVDRLLFIKRALGCGLTLDDISALVDSASLVTCGDVYGVVRRRLEEIRQSGHADTPGAALLEKLLDVCARVGPRRECKILTTLVGADC